MSAAENLKQLHRHMDCRIKSGNDEVRKNETNKGSGTPTDAVSHVPHASGARVAPRRKRLAPPHRCRARSPVGVPPRLLPEGLSSQRLSFRPGFLGRGGALGPKCPPQPGGGDLAQFKRALPAPACP